MSYGHILSLAIPTKKFSIFSLILFFTETKQTFDYRLSYAYDAFSNCDSSSIYSCLKFGLLQLNWSGSDYSTDLL